MIPISRGTGSNCRRLAISDGPDNLYEKHRFVCRSAHELATKPPIDDLSALIIEDLTGAEYDACLDVLGR